MRTVAGCKWQQTGRAQFFALLLCLAALLEPSEEVHRERSGWCNRALPSSTYQWPVVKAALLLDTLRREAG